MEAPCQRDPRNQDDGRTHRAFEATGTPFIATPFFSWRSTAFLGRPWAAGARLVVNADAGRAFHLCRGTEPKVRRSCCTRPCSGNTQDPSPAGAAFHAGRDLHASPASPGLFFSPESRSISPNARRTPTTANAGLADPRRHPRLVLVQQVHAQRDCAAGDADRPVRPRSAVSGDPRPPALSGLRIKGHSRSA